MDDPGSYRPISLLCVSYKLLERLLLFRLEPVVDPQLPTEQGGFRRNRSTVQQVVKLTSDIEDSCEGRRKAGLVLVDLTAAYDTVWHQGLALKLLQTIPDRHLVRFIVDITLNRSFIFRTSDGQWSRLRRLKNGVSQGSTLAPMLFNIYISDIPDTVSTQCGCADYLALLFSHKCWSEVEEVLSLDMQRIAECLSAWRLRLSTAKTTCTVFHLNNKEPSRKLAVTVNGTTIPTPRIQLNLESRLTANSPSGNTWKASVAKLEPVIDSYAFWLSQHGVLTPLFCELQRWTWSTVPQNMPPQLGAAAPILKS